jgi:hypothetical protein
LKTFVTKQESTIHEEYLQRFFEVHKNQLFINRQISGKSFNLDYMFENKTHHFFDSEWQSKMNKKRLADGSHQFLDRNWQREMSRRAHSRDHPLHGGKIQRETNKRRIADGTHNLLGRSDEVKDFIQKRIHRENVKELQQLKNSLGVKLGQCWNRKPDEWIDAKIAELRSLL